MANEDMVHPGVDHDYDLTEIASSVHKVLMTLTPREERVLRMRYGIGVDEHTLEEISKDFGTTRERIRQIEQKALIKLRKPSRSRDLVVFKNHFMDRARRRVRKKAKEVLEYEKRYDDYLKGRISVNALLGRPEELEKPRRLPWADSISIFKPIVDSTPVKYYHPSVCAQCGCTPTYYYRLSWNAWKISNSWWEFCTYGCRAKTFDRLNLAH